MIVLDENISDRLRVHDPIAGWYRGKVVIIRDLRPRTRILDEAIPRLLARQKQPTFVTTNVMDFWQRVAADRRYCIICLSLPNERQGEISDLLHRLFRLPDFKTKSTRMGKVVRISQASIQFYQMGDEAIQVMEWK